MIINSQLKIPYSRAVGILKPQIEIIDIAQSCWV